MKSIKPLYEECESFLESYKTLDGIKERLAPYLKDLVKINDNEYLVEGSTKISDVNEQLGINLESEEFDSIGGFIIGYLKRIPEENEIIEVEDVKFKVESIDKNRINKIRIFV